MRLESHEDVVFFRDGGPVERKNPNGSLPLILNKRGLRKRRTCFGLHQKARSMISVLLEGLGRTNSDVWKIAVVRWKGRLQGFRGVEMNFAG